MGTSTLIVARTDSESATLLDSNHDPRDQPFIIGSTNPNQIPLNEVIRTAIENNLPIVEIQKIRENWLKTANLCTYRNAVSRQLLDRKGPHVNEIWMKQSKKLSNSDARYCTVIFEYSLTFIWFV